MNKCFGIISWLPDKEPARQQRKDRVNRLFKQLNSLWPEIDILIITQNWKNFTPIEIKNKINKVDFEKGLGILKARKTLRKEFLKLDYDYLIMLDDDAIIKCESQTAAKDFMDEVNKHKDGFCFIHHKNYETKEETAIDTYAAAQLNLCAISKYILSKEDIPSVDPQKGEAYEDRVYSVLLHHKYHDYEFYPPKTIRCIQFQNAHEVAPSTWAYGSSKFLKLSERTDKIAAYIKNNKELPNLTIYFELDILVTKDTGFDNWYVKKLLENKKVQATKSKNYLYF